MNNEAWLNLPVSDIIKSKKFFSQIGVRFSKMESPTMLGLELGKGPFRVMLFTHPQFEQFTQSKVVDLNSSAEMLISIEASSKEEVDSLAEKVMQAGGILFAGPETWQGWMYGMGFQDLDGHRWNIAYMDWEKKPN